MPIVLWRSLNKELYHIARISIVKLQQALFFNIIFEVHSIFCVRYEGLEGSSVMKLTLATFMTYKFLAKASYAAEIRPALLTLSCTYIALNHLSYITKEIGSWILYHLLQACADLLYEIRKYKLSYGSITQYRSLLSHWPEGLVGRRGSGAEKIWSENSRKFNRQNGLKIVTTFTAPYLTQ
jgi:hypothetical protein